MKRRSLLVGSALASVGAMLGVGKMAEISEPTKGIRITNQGGASVTTNPWDYAREIQPVADLDVEFPIGTWDRWEVSGYEIKQQLDRGWISRKTAIEAMGLDAEEIEEASNLWSRDAILARERFITNSQPYRLSGPDSRRAGI